MIPDDSAMASLLAELGNCAVNSPCGYHRVKSIGFSDQFPPAGIAPSNDQFTVQSTRHTRSLVAALDSARQPAGSWHLVSEDERWLSDRLAELPSTATLTLAILGVASHVHFEDTLDIISEVSIPPQSLHFFVIEKCISPLIDVYHMCVSRRIPVTLHSQDLDLASQGEPSRVRVTLLQHDLTSGLPQPWPNAQVILMHYLLRFLNAAEARRVFLELAQEMAGLESHVLMAQEDTPFTVPTLPHYIRSFGFEIEVHGHSWAPYRLPHEKRRAMLTEETIQVPADCHLLQFRVTSDEPR